MNKSPVEEYREIPGYPNYKINKKGDILNASNKAIKKYYNKGEPSQWIVFLFNAGKRKAFKLNRLISSVFYPFEYSDKNFMCYVIGEKDDVSFENTKVVKIK